MNFAKKALVTTCLTLGAGNAFGFSQGSPPSWGLDRIDQATGSDSNYIYDTEAADIPVFTVDTGIDAAHDDFEGRAVLWRNIVNDSQSECTSGPANHGTAVAGIIGGRTYGVAKKVKIYAVRTISCTSGASAVWIEQALNEIVANGPTAPNGTRGVINMSVQIPGTNTADAQRVINAVNNAVNAGFVVVAAAGNANTDACNATPAHMPNVITVGATDSNDARWSSSNHGTCVKIFAPGVSVLGPKVGDPMSHFTATGTSYAAPHVAGAAALLLAKGVAPSQVLARLQSDASEVVSNVNTATTTTKRLWTRPVDDCELSNGGSVVKSGNQGSITDCSMVVPAGRTSVTFKITGGTGDADLYVRFGAKPEPYVYDCRPLRAGNEETCTMYIPNNPAWQNGGRWYVQLRGYRTFSTTLSGQYQ